jgi:hypothetical protein
MIQCFRESSMGPTCESRIVFPSNLHSGSVVIAITSTSYCLHLVLWSRIARCLLPFLVSLLAWGNEVLKQRKAVIHSLLGHG